MFHSVAASTVSGAARCVNGGELYLMCSFGAYKGPPEGAEKALGDKPVPYSDEIKALDVSDVGMFRPEVLLRETGVELDSESLAALADGSCVLPVANPPRGYASGYWLLKSVPGVSGGWRLLKILEGPEEVSGLQMFPLYLQPEIRQVLRGRAGEVRLSMRRVKLSKTSVMFVYSDGEGMLYLLGCCMCNKSCIGQITVEDDDDSVIVPDGWLSSNEWKRLTIKRTKKKMKGLTNPTRQDAAPAAPAATVKPEADIVAPSPSPAPEPAPVKAPEPAPVQVAAAEPAQAQAEQSDSKPRITRVRRDSKAVGLDLSKVIEDVSAPVPDISLDGLDKVQEEIRSLRDLQIAAARRVANLHAAVVKASATAIEKWAALQALMK